MVTVALDWKYFNWLPSETWTRETLPKIRAAGIKEKELGRSVYVIRLNGYFCVQYPCGQSPTLYIGEGNFNQRITQHRKWVIELQDLVADHTFEVCIAVPRVRRSEKAYRDCEAALLERFGARFGTAPLWNKQFESRLFDYEYDKRQLDVVLGKRSGAKYRWAVAPMPASGFHDNFVRTHL